ncbi:MAG TPA: hypothetical protein VHL60_02060 [Oxalicibacterium sp.]|jgi:hypothetical protein|nr:hypothetical protein [Oxalicibacterium sp.]
MKSRFFANLCLTLLLLFAQHVALADAYARHARHAVSDQTTTQSVLEEGSSSSDNNDTGNHFSLDDLDSGLISTFVLPAFANTAPFQAHSPFSDFFTVFLQFYSTRAPPAA